MPQRVIPDALTVSDPGATDDPRNPWAKLQQVFALLRKGDLASAQVILEKIRYHADLPEEIFDSYLKLAANVEKNYRSKPRFNTPSDYTGSRVRSVLRPFRQLAYTTDIAKPYPWSMTLPPYIGARNDYRFLKECAARLESGYSDTITRIHVIISPVTTPDDTPRLITQLAGMDHKGQLHVTAFGTSPFDAPKLRHGGKTTFHPFPLLSEKGQKALTQIAAASDLLLFIGGTLSTDPTLIMRAKATAEISDAVIMPLAQAPTDMVVTTPYRDEPLRKRFSGTYPFRDLSGLNFAIPSRLLHKTGLFDLRYRTGFYAAKDLAYRAFVHGAWFVPLGVSELIHFDDSPEHPSDFDLFKQRCPTHWDRKRDALHEVPLVSIYIPAYNASKYIERAIDSALAQDVQDLDVCIANDGSTDDTLAILQRRYNDEKRVRWLDNRNGGIGYASNAAIRMSNSLYIGQLDSDDCLKPGAVRRLMAYLNENPAVVCAYSSCERIDAQGNFTQNEYSWPVFSRQKMMLTSITHHFRMFRRQAWSRTSGFREDIVNGVDYDIFLKLSELGPFHHIDEQLYQRRWHGENTSHVNEHHQTANTYRVQRESLKRQGLDKFWDVAVPDSAQPRKITYTLRENTKMVVFWPDYSRSNPYQKLLYSSLRDTAEVVAGEIDAALKLIETKVLNASDITFHLHWLNRVFNEATHRESAQTLADTFIAKIEKFVWKGGRFVWTIHNTVSHDSPYADIESSLSSRLAAAAHLIHLHSAESLAEVASHFPVPASKVLISRHGSYVGAYADHIDKATARQLLNIGPDEDVIIFTGQIRPYKGIETLASVFGNILRDRPQTRLILAGRNEGISIDELSLSEHERSRIISSGGFVEDDEFQVYLRAADIAAFPYQKILTSGSLMLALSFGVPTVIPRVGMTKDVLEGKSAGILYDADNALDELEKALRSLLDAKQSGQLKQMSINARKLAEQLTWPDLGVLLK